MTEEEREVERKIDQQCAVLMKNGFTVGRAVKRIGSTLAYTLSDAVTSAAWFLMCQGFKLPPHLDFEGRGGQ